MNVLDYPKKTDNGFVANMPEGQYHAHPAISKSGLDKVNQSPAHYQVRDQFQPSNEMLIGTAIHLAILEPDRFESEYHFTTAEDRRQADYKEAVAEYGVERVLLPNDAKNIREIQKSSLAIPHIAALAHAEGWAEVSAFAEDPETGVAVRCRYDRLAAAGFAVDLKKARNVFPHGFSNAIASYRYHVQVAFYSDIYYWITGERLSEFWLIAIEKKPPYTIVPYQLDDIAVEAGRLAYRKDLNTYAACLNSNEWPTYEPEEHLLTLPNWALAEFEDQMEIY